MQNRVTNVIIGIEKEAGFAEWGEKAFNTVKGWGSKAMESGAGQKMKQWGTKATGFAAKHPVGVAAGVGAGSLAVGGAIGHHFGAKQPKVQVNNNFNRKQAEDKSTANPYITGLGVGGVLGGAGIAAHGAVANKTRTVQDIASRLAKKDLFSTEIQKQLQHLPQGVDTIELDTIIPKNTLGIETQQDVTNYAKRRVGELEAEAKNIIEKNKLIRRNKYIIGGMLGAAGLSALAYNHYKNKNQKTAEFIGGNSMYTVTDVVLEKIAGSSDIASAVILANALNSPKVAPSIKDLPIPPEEYMRRQGKVSTVAGAVLGALAGTGVGLAAESAPAAVIGGLVGAGLGAAAGHYGNRLQQYQYGYTPKDVAARKKKVADAIGVIKGNSNSPKYPMPKKTYDRLMKEKFSPNKYGLVGGVLGGTIGAGTGKAIGEALKHSHIGTGAGAVLGATLGALGAQYVNRAGIESRNEFYPV